MSEGYDLKTEFAARLKKMRKEQGISQRQLAAELNISSEYVSRIERGLQLPAIDIMIAISDYFCKTLDYTICGREVENSLDRIPKEIVEFYEESDEHEQRCLIEIIRSMRMMMYQTGMLKLNSKPE